MPDVVKKAHRILGALILGGTADALGWRNESADENSLRKPVLRLQAWSKRVGRVGGYWDRIEPGEYSDDTQLTLAVARCVSPHGDYDAERFVRTELPYWLTYERGGGRTVRSAARNAQHRLAVSWDTNVFEGYYESGANGAAMRISPIALIPDRRKMILAVWQNALATHGHPRAIVGACIMASSMHSLLRAPDPDGQRLREAAIAGLDETVIPENDRVRQWVESAGGEKFVRIFESARDEMANFLELAWHGRTDTPKKVLQQLGCFDVKTKGSGTACVAAAHYFTYAFENNPFRAVVEAANTLGTDTDTIAKLTGDVLGCIYGRAAYENDLTETLINRFYLLTIARYLIGTEEPHWTSAEQKETELMGNEKEGDEYYSHVFGPGVISSVRQPLLIRKGSALLTQVKVSFQCGLSCTFSKPIPVNDRQSRVEYEFSR